MLDRERILVRVDRLEGYLRELRQLVPENFEEYLDVRTRRACERLLQLAIESVTDVCALLVAGLRLGLPSHETDVFTALGDADVLSSPVVEILKRMRGMRNILIHEYLDVDDQLVYEVLSSQLNDFDAFVGEVVQSMGRQ